MTEEPLARAGAETTEPNALVPPAEHERRGVVDDEPRRRWTARSSC